MSRPRVLCVLSSDFGEYVTASLFARSQPFDVHFALPAALSAYVPPGSRGHSVYRSLAEAKRLVTNARPDAVLLASGYLFAVNGLASLEELESFVREVRATGAALATTDPWLRVWRLRPESRYAIHSVQKGGEEGVLSARMNALQASLEALFDGVPHVFAAPLADEGRGWHAFFNGAFAERAAAERREGGEWLFVLSREDYVFLAGFEREAFFRGLGERVAELLARDDRRVRFVAPDEVGRFLAERWPDEPRLAHTGFCDFAAFERLLREAHAVAYWNLLSSSLLYCLYYGVAPVFFGAGHLAKVCPGLAEHAAAHVYCGRPPRLRSLSEPLEADTATVSAWVQWLRGRYASLPAPAAVLARIREKA